jgi:hypothetical protein
MVAKAEREGLIAWLENLFEEGFDVLLVFFDKLLLDSALIDEEAYAEGSWLSWAKKRIFCGTPSSTTIKSFWVRPVTRRPSASRTLSVVSIR